jgi:hypothetical protein
MAYLQFGGAHHERALSFLLNVRKRSSTTTGVFIPNKPPKP